jgi:hypothetical protein
MNVAEIEKLVGSHYIKPIVIGLPDDGFGNAVYYESKVIPNAITGANSSARIKFIFDNHNH